MKELENLTPEKAHIYFTKMIDIFPAFMGFYTINTLNNCIKGSLFKYKLYPIDLGQYCHSIYGVLINDEELKWLIDVLNKEQYDKEIKDLINA